MEIYNLKDNLPRLKNCYLTMGTFDGCHIGHQKLFSNLSREAKENKSQPKIMMVTILTALSDEDLKATGSNSTVNEQVGQLAKLAKEVGTGIVCSGHEAKNVRKIVGPDILIFTPGIRMNKENKDDQQRVCTPLESINNGANKIIMGRSLIKGNIEENIDKVSNSIKE